MKFLPPNVAHAIQTTPAILWAIFWVFIGSLAALAIYEIVSLITGQIPTISSLVIPQIKSHLGLAIFILCMFLGFVAFLLWDWFGVGR